jgi:hypothetical protein
VKWQINCVVPLHVIKVYGALAGMVQHTKSTLALDEGQFHILGILHYLEKGSGTHCTEGCIGLRISGCGSEEKDLYTPAEN